MKDGTAIPGVTTVISGSLGWNKGALLYWAWKQGKDGKDYRETTTQAANAGTLAHYLVDCELTKKPVDLEYVKTFDEKAQKRGQRGFENFQKWALGNQLRIFFTEQPLVSEKWRFGGCPDAVALIGGESSILDWKTSKTSKDVYPEYLIQVAGGYKMLCEENFPDQSPPFTRIDIVKFSKESASFGHHQFDIADAGPPCEKAFLYLLGLHRISEKIKSL